MKRRGFFATLFGAAAVAKAEPTSARLSIEQVARLFRVPPHMIGPLERSTFTTIHDSDTFRVYLPGMEPHDPHVR